MKLPSGFDLSSIEVFMLTAELGGMTQSAQHLGMTQSAVSQTILRLEAALESRLFDRAMRPLALTPNGKLLFRDGARLLASARSLVGEVREGSERPFDQVAIAMGESIANHLTAPLLTMLAGRAERWLVRSGISLLQQHEFVARKLDILITGSSQLDTVAGVEHRRIMDEGFIVIAPHGWAGDDDEPIERLTERPFVRYSLLSAMGQRIERQVTRMRLRLSHGAEVDSTMQQVTAVAAGVGWSITTPLCLASHPDLWSGFQVRPMPRARFRRRIQLVSRSGEFGDLPREIAALASHTLRGGRIARLCREMPWIAEVLAWPEADGEAGAAAQAG